MSPHARLSSLSALLISVLCAWASPSAAEPAFFTDKPYGEAKQAASDNDKLLFVKATAVWCGPCKMMDRTTFVDQRVIDWLTEKAVSVSVDVDDEPALAGRLKVRAMPTTILFRGDEELARVVGYRDADALLAWLAQAEGGEIVPIAERPRPAPRDIRGRLDRARELARADKFGEATDEYLWLWDNMVTQDPGMVGVRGSFMASSMSDLAKRSPEAKAEFVKLRDRTEDRLVDGEGEKTWNDLRDWLILNERVLHDREPIRKWIGRVKERPTAKMTFTRTRDIIDDILIDDGQWALYGELIENPFRDIEMHQMLAKMDKPANEQMDEGMRAQLESAERRRFSNNISKTVAALLAAGREDEARQVADRAIEIQDDVMMRAGIVAKSLDAEQARGWHLGLLDGAPDDFAAKLKPMRDRVEAMLRG